MLNSFRTRPHFITHLLRGDVCASRPITIDVKSDHRPSNLKVSGNASLSSSINQNKTPDFLNLFIGNFCSLASISSSVSSAYHCMVSILSSRYPFKIFKAVVGSFAINVINFRKTEGVGEKRQGNKAMNGFYFELPIFHDLNKRVSTDLVDCADKNAWASNTTPNLVRANLSFIGRFVFNINSRYFSPFHIRRSFMP